MAKNSIQIQKWLDEDKRVNDLEETLKIPDISLSDVPSVLITKETDLNQIPEKEGGCYWIWTDESVNHKLHKNKIPSKINGGRIIYNGIAKDDVRGRVKHHLFGEIGQGWSGISMDLLFDNPKSHAKLAMTTQKESRKKVAFLLDNRKINNKILLLELSLAENEKAFVEKTKNDEIYFRNGINVTEKKHRGHKFVVYYITGLKSMTYLEFIEKAWRQKYHTPQLCSYISGR